MTWTVERCLREDPKLSRTDLEYLKEWHKKQPHLPPITDIQIITFLHCTYYSLEKAKVYIDKYFTIRTHAPELFANRSFLLPETALQEQFMCVGELPMCDSNGYRVLGFRLRAVNDLTDLVHERANCLALSINDHLIKKYPICPGWIGIFDAANLQIGHITKVSISTLKKMLLYMQEASPFRLKALHIINLNPMAEKLLLLMKPFMGEEIQNMIRYHSGAMESLYEELPKDMLPIEFGGTSGSIIDYHNKLFERLKEARKEIVEEEELLVNEALRPGRAKDSGEVFGMEGSFKKMDID